LITTAACPVHCRYCFRRHFPYSEQTAARDDWRAALSAIENDASIAEVILSGGDPLSLSNHRLASLIARLERVRHVTTLRIHSRYPIILPERIDSELLEMLSATRLRVVVVVHCNHPNEIDAAVGIGLGALRGAGICVLNQSVLLREINDDVSVLAALSWELFHAGALPYYLHELDAVAGAAHFKVSHEHAQSLVFALRQRVPGYLVPRLVREIPGELSKTVVG
jgi:EF-P beta-lysylation protein EpmB